MDKTNSAQKSLVITVNSVTAQTIIAPSLLKKLNR